MEKKIETVQPNLQPEVTPPVERQAQGGLFHTQPNGGVESSIPFMLMTPFAGDGEE